MDKKHSKSLELYSTSACHLCELAEKLFLEEELSDFLVQSSVNIRKVDISQSEQLFEKYGTRIPVIKLEDCNSDLGWPFDEQSVLNYLESALSK